MNHVRNNVTELLGEILQLHRYLSITSITSYDPSGSSHGNPVMNCPSPPPPPPYTPAFCTNTDI